jgi:hypothetical protein
MAGMVAAQIADATANSYEPARSAPSAVTARNPFLLVQPQVGMVRDSERRSVPTLGVVLAF